MSMISRLIDELNKSADEWNGSNMFELAHMCRDAADTIWQLRDDLQRANAENAKLRNEVDNLMDFEHLTSVAVAYAGCDECGEYKQTMLRLFAENAKLRELANGYEALTATLCNERECDGCPFDDPEQIVCEHMRLQTCLSELGIEVTA